MSNLPEWVWQLLEALDQYEDEHPSLYFEHYSGEWRRWPCFGSIAEEIVPADVMRMASTMRERKARTP